MNAIKIALVLFVLFVASRALAFSPVTFPASGDTTSPVTLSTSFSDLQTDYDWQMWNSPDISGATHYCFVYRVNSTTYHWSPATPVANTSFSWSENLTEGDTINGFSVQMLAVNAPEVCGDDANYEGDGIGIEMNVETTNLGLDTGPWTIVAGTSTPVVSATSTDGYAQNVALFSALWGITFMFGFWLLVTFT